VKIRVVEEDVNGANLLCPYVVCEGCDGVIKVGEDAIVLRQGMLGDVQDTAYHSGRCDPGGSFWRPLKDWIDQVRMNSVGRLG
jgi:hypothetical protein